MQVLAYTALTLTSHILYNYKFKHQYNPLTLYVSLTTSTYHSYINLWLYFLCPPWLAPPQCVLYNNEKHNS